MPKRAHPTLILEVGWSESPQKLAIDCAGMKWEEDDHNDHNDRHDHDDDDDDNSTTSSILDPTCYFDSIPCARGSELVGASGRVGGVPGCRGRTVPSFPPPPQLRRHLREAHPGATANTSRRNVDTLEIAQGRNEIKRWVLTQGWRNACYVHEPGRGPLGDYARSIPAHPTSRRIPKKRFIEIRVIT
ncbi:hypothetical protein AJ80_02250 [Polytolypa hystricis UAMH7299]|uniref:Uncharacterized protein n=1 Tax=Polytolypa hystricis (strain UAMH7299) TaxID=1447883 RepID=A0A2B7YHS4_POLH7|nr:hypothetical protein AJ80_02250 [Polytolypa hystricis UAMH7299]